MGSVICEIDVSIGIVVIRLASGRTQRAGSGETPEELPGAPARIGHHYVVAEPAVAWSI